MPNHYYSFTWHIYRKAMQSYSYSVK